MTTEKLIFYILCGMESETVAQQFIDVFENGESMANQNRNALNYVKDALNQLKDVDALSTVRDEIEMFESEITDYLDKK